MSVTKLELSLADGTGFFSTKSYTSSTDAGTEVSGATAAFTLKSLRTAGTQGLGSVTASGSTYKLEKIGSAITDITAGGSTKKWDIIVDSNATSVKTIIGSDQDDMFSIAGGSSTEGIQLTTGTGKDTIDVGNLGANVTLTDYTYGSDVIKLSSVGNDVQSSITSAGLFTANNKTVTLNATGGYYKATLTDGNSAYNVWKGGTDARTLDGSGESSKLIMMVGDKSDTLVGGSKGDSIFLSSVGGAWAIGGGGNDSIQLGANGAADSIRQYVAASTDSGKDIVTGFETGFVDTADVLVLQDGSISGLKFTPDDTPGNGTSIKNDGGSVSLGSADATNSLQLLIQDANALSKVGVVNGTSADGYKLASGEDIADYYISTGKVGFVNFAAVEDEVKVELSNAGNYEDNATFVGIDSVTGGKGKTTLVGDGETKNYLKSGNGETTLWGGGASNDTLVGGTAADAFFVGAYDGKDTIVGFDAQTEDAVDALYMMNSPVASINRDTSATKFTFADGSSVAIAAEGSKFGKDDVLKFTLDGTTFQTAKIGVTNDDNAFSYGTDTKMFFGGSKTDTLTIDSSKYDGSSVDVRLNNTLDQSYSSIEKVSAATFDGKAFISGSDESSEILIGGTGKTTLWGGLGAVADTLQGTNGDVTEFFFGANNGEDIIAKSDSDDKVVFYDFANTDLTAIDTTGSQLKFTFSDGSSLQIKDYTSESAKTFEFTNSSWTYDKASRTFTQTK